jgi:pimeloyl-ACP methyl ester carboxylesterase
VLARRLTFTLAIALVACGGLARRNAPLHVALGGGLCEERYTISRPPGGPYDRIGLDRVARCAGGGANDPVVFYLPGMHMNGTLVRDDALADVRHDLARAGARVWSVDYRTHAVPADASPAALEALAGWTPDVFADDATAAAAFAREHDTGPFFVAGFSYGAGLAYRLAGRGLPMRGLIILDGAPPDGHAPEDGPPAIDVGGHRLPYDVRAQLLAAVLTDPAGPSPVPDFKTAGDALSETIYTVPSFGGKGGLSAAKSGVTDVRALAALLATYDRWWPRAALGGAAVATPAEPPPVLAFASTAMGPAWTARVRSGAQRFAGRRVRVHELRGYGHLDVLIARDAERLVARPIVDFLAILAFANP